MNTDQQLVLRVVNDLVADPSAHWVIPSVRDCWIFLSTEVAEVGDALLRSGFADKDGYTRNQQDKEVNLPEELADVQLMLIMLANLLNVDLREELHKKLTILTQRAHDQHKPVSSTEVRKA